MTRLKKYVSNGALMTAVALILRGLGVAWSANISQRIGAEALGLYTLLGSVYGFALTLALSGINLTATRLVSDALGEGDGAKLRVSMKKCICYSLFFGILSAVLLAVFAEPLSLRALGDARCILPLRLSAVTLPLIALSSCFNGYFTAVRRVYKNAVVQISEQLMKIFFCTSLLSLAFARDVESACICLVLGGALAEMISFAITVTFYAFEKNRHGAQAASPIPERAVTKKMLSIALPLAASTYFRSALLTLEHILIPIGIEKSGSNRAASLAAYGTFQSMAMPLVLFPSAIIHSYSGLLVPELAQLKIRGEYREIRYVAERVCRLAIVFAVGVSGILIYFSDALGEGLYRSAEAGKYIRVVAHIVPIMYLDTTVDNMLKGLGEHLYTMAINITDTMCSLVMVWILIPRMGIWGYVALIIISEIFNSGASIYKLKRVTGMRMPLFRWFCVPVISIVVCTNVGGALLTSAGAPTALSIVLCAAAYPGILLLLGNITREECRWVGKIFTRARKNSHPAESAENGVINS